MKTKVKNKKVGRPSQIKDAIITHFYISGKDNDELRRWAELADVSVAELTRQFITNGLNSLNGSDVTYSKIKDKCKDRLSAVDSKIAKMEAKREALAAELNGVV